MTISRRTLIVTGIVIIALIAVGVVAYLAGRSTSEPPATTATPPAGSGPASPSHAPTDSNGSPEPALARGQAVAGAGGSTSGPAQIPLGYTHDQTGAVNAATNYLTWMNSIKIKDKPTADAMAVATAADEATRTALITSFDMLRTGMEDLTADQPEPARGAFAVAKYSPTTALIYIWAPEVTTDANGQQDHVWGIDAVPLVWSGDWKLNGALIAKTGGAAVDPADPTGNPSAEEKHSILTRTPADPGDITDSADQTWFEYGNAMR